MSLLPIYNYIILNKYDWYVCKYTPLKQFIEATKYNDYNTAKYNANINKNNNIYLETKIIPIIKLSPQIYKTYKIKKEFEKDVKYI